VGSPYVFSGAAVFEQLAVGHLARAVADGFEIDLLGGVEHVSILDGEFRGRQGRRLQVQSLYKKSDASDTRGGWGVSVARRAPPPLAYS
jgi:hypothetical protein